MKLNIALLAVLASNSAGIWTNILPRAHAWDTSNTSLSTDITLLWTGATSRPVGITSLSTSSIPRPLQSSTAETVRIQHHTRPRRTPQAITPPGPRAHKRNHETSYQTIAFDFPRACGLVVPRAEVWQRYHHLLVPFVQRNREEFMHNAATKSFAIFLRDKYAPNASPSSLFCDVIGQCSIGSCINLSYDFSTEERQLAYLVFEQIAGIDHIMQVSARATETAGLYTLGRVGWLVDNFSSARRIEQALKTKATARKIGMAAASAFGLMASGGLGTPGDFLKSNPFWLQTGNAAVGLIVNAYVGAVGIINAMAEEVPDLDGNLESWLTYTLNEIIHKRAVNIDDDLRNLMTGKANHKGMTVFDILTNEDFLGPDPNLQMALTQVEERFLFAVSVNAVWRFDRPYLLDTDVHFGTCRWDTRGDPRYRVCLDEFPMKSFWLYNIGQGREDDTFHDDQAQVSGPSGLHRFNSASEQTYNITQEDIVRSSLWVHKNGLSDAIEAINVPEIGKAFKKEGVDLLDNDAVHWPSDPKKSRLLGLVPGAFAVPVCRNPGGEAISSVNDDKSRNYPCMCGEFGWKHGWSYEKDQTPNFLVRSGFMFSEDWEDYCSDHNDCRGDNDRDLHAWLNGKREDGDPGIPRKLKHPFKKCTDPKSHDHKGHTGPEY